MLKAVIFDMDGVLIDSEGFYQERRSNFLGKYGIKSDDKANAKLLGRTFQEVLAHYFPPEEMEQVLPAYVTYREQHKPDYRQLLDPAAELLLQWLKRYRLKLALASSSPMSTIQDVMAASDWGEYFDLMLSGADLPRSKPDPAIYLLTLEKLGIAADEAVVIEDAANGIAAAKAAGLKVIAKANLQFPQDVSQADYQVQQLSEVKKVLVNEEFLSNEA